MVNKDKDPNECMSTFLSNVNLEEEECKFDPSETKVFNEMLNKTKLG